MIRRRSQNRLRWHLVFAPLDLGDAMSKIGRLLLSLSLVMNLTTIVQEGY